jgi:1-acyl-sn-glycerol-3-phosphate acyltransferase
LNLAISGVEMEVQGIEHLTGRQPRVVAFNHASMLDLFIVCALLPEGSAPVIKREIIYFPFLGWAVWGLGFVLVDRKNPERAKASLQRAAARVGREQLTVFISPEGTRTRDGSLGPFKLGPMRLAQATELPVTPMVIHNAYDLMPNGVLYTRPGKVRVEMLPPVTLAGDDVRHSTAQLREIFVQALSGR